VLLLQVLVAERDGPGAEPGCDVHALVDGTTQFATAFYLIRADPIAGYNYRESDDRHE
jgi:hypothetical protein